MNEGTVIQTHTRTHGAIATVNPMKSASFPVPEALAGFMGSGR